MRKKKLSETMPTLTLLKKKSFKIIKIFQSVGISKMKHKIHVLFNFSFICPLTYTRFLTDLLSSNIYSYS